FAGGHADGREVQLAIGLETKPYRIPGFQRTQASNWIVAGINVQRQEDTGSTTSDSTFGLVTYRSFLGQAFLWRRSADPGKTASRLITEFLKQAPTYEAAGPVYEKIKAIDANKRTSAQQLLYGVYIEAGG